jgi:hypothetical protein
VTTSEKTTFKVGMKPTLTFFTVLLLARLWGVDCAAMLYKPSVGRFKDGFVFWNQDEFHLFSMYKTGGDDSNFRNVWLATSTDGVHWKEIGPVIKDAPFNIWAMAVHRVGDRFIMNHGSFTKPNVQNVIRFWESQDLLHWTYMGSQADLLPDTRWYPANSRLDCMSVVPVVEGGKTRYYGYATGPGGFLESDDGVGWSGKPRPEIDWGVFPPPATPKVEGILEIGGCQEMGDRFYLVGGWFNYMGHTGYGVFTLAAKSPNGPFIADSASYRLCGNSTRWVSLWARFCPVKEEVLVNGYMYSGYSYETGETWLPPLKKAIVDSKGHLRLGYWKGNDVLHSAYTKVDFSKCRRVYPNSQNGDCRVIASGNHLELQAQPERNSLLRLNVPRTVAILDGQVDCAKGIVLEGTLQTPCRDRRLVAPAAGFFLEENDREGTAILLQSQGQTDIGRLTVGDRGEFFSEDIIGPGCAAPAGVVPHENHTFRLFVRKNMFELYLDDLLVQTFNTTHDPNTPGVIPRRIGFIAENGQAIFDNVKVAPMTLGE